MIANEKYFRIARGLKEKTLSGQAKWDSSENSLRKFSLRLPASSVVLRYCTPDTEPDFILLQLCKPDGTMVGEWKVYEGEADWELAHGLYRAVEHQIGGWEAVIQDIDRFLQGSGAS